MAGYPGQFGTVLVKKETLDKSLKTIEGAPVIINHTDVTVDNADDLRVGVISNAYYNEKDGWYWCEGIIWDKTAQSLITDKGWSVSCSYDFLEENDEGGSENNVPYDREFTKLNFVHLALVDNPRYERANIVFNSKTDNSYDPNQKRDKKGKWTKENGINPNYKEELKQVIDKAKNNPNERQKLVIGKVSKDLEEKAKENGFDIAEYNHDLDVSGTRHSFKQHGNKNIEDLRGQIAITDEDFERIPEIVYDYDDINFGEYDEKGTPLIKYHKQFDDGTSIYAEEIRTRQKTLTIKSLYKRKNKNADNSCSFTDFNPQRLEYISNIIITDNSEDFNPDITKNEVHNEKEQDMALLEELKKLISTVENSKGEEMVDNAKIDKRKLIDEIGGILKGKVDEEVWRTIIGKIEKVAYDESSRGTADNEKVDKRDVIRKIMAIAGKHEDNEDVRTIAKLAEKLAYDKSEADTSDNKKEVKNESEEDKKKVKDLKEDMQDDVYNKKKSCDNGVDNSKTDYYSRMNEIYNASTTPPKQEEYISRADRLKAAEEYFG